MGQAIVVGMSEMRLTADPCDMLVALGLGSCIGLCAYDRFAHIAGMVHVVLPESAGRTDGPPAKHADTAVPELMQAMRRQGASMRNIVVALAGGAQVFSFQGVGQRMDIGSRNAAAVLAALVRLGLNPLAQDVGGGTGRTVYFRVSDGSVRVKTIGRGEQTLVVLGEREPMVYRRAA